MPRSFVTRSTIRVGHSVFDTHQIQSLCRCGFSCVRPVAGVENSSDVCGSPASTANVNPRADDRADHVVEKSIRFDIETKTGRVVACRFRERVERGLFGRVAGKRTCQVGCIPGVPCGDPFDGSVINGADAGGPIRPLGFEAAEIMSSHQALDGRVHGHIIQR